MIRTVLFIGALIIGLIKLPIASYGQCDIKPEYKVEESSIHLKVDKPGAELSIQLYDLIRDRVVAEKTQFHANTNWTLAFKDVENSTYVLILKYNGCEIILGGLGINVHSNTLPR